MASKPVDGHQRAHHHAHHAHHHHHAQSAHKSAEKPTKADKPTQPKPPGQAAQQPESAPPQAAAGAPVPKDKFTPPTTQPVNITPGATGEHKAPPQAAAGAPAPAPKTGTGTGVVAAPAPATGNGTGAVAAPKTQPPVANPAALSWIGQLAPTGASTGYDGAMNCGPAAGAMIARATGYQPTMSDGALVEQLAGFGQTSPELGTTGNGMIAMYQEMGMETAAIPGADMTWINNQLTSGRYVTALGDYYQVPGRIDDSKTAGHYLDVTGYHKATKHQDARYVVRDPANEALKKMTAAELQSFITAAPQGGFAIACWPDPTVL
ncbi:MAG TPA: C39 family peptidase [Myxococcaceae bacterium]|nr:C39 family peptidase [Myxococcaceae bacterium]